MKEEEVKKANRIILATKCSIIRGAQIAEKNEIAREFHNENLRLEKIMLEERDKALAEEELKREQERKNLLKYSKEIRKQLEEREQIRAKEVERIEEEALAMKKALDVIEKVRLGFFFITRISWIQLEVQLSLISFLGFFNNSY